MWVEGSVRHCKEVLAKEPWWSTAQAGGWKQRGSWGFHNSLTDPSKCGGHNMTEPQIKRPPDITKLFPKISVVSRLRMWLLQTFS